MAGLWPSNTAMTATNADLQQLIDRAACDGQRRVTLPAGEYLMHDSLKLRSGVQIVGAPGSASGRVVLRKAPSVSSPVLDCLGYGHYEFRVAEPDRFRVGTGVHFYDDNAGGFYTTVATVVGRSGDLLFIDRPFNHDYLPIRGAMAVSAFPIVEGCDISDASIENVVIDGNYPAETFCLNGCRGGGVFLIGCQRVSVRGVEVRNYHGDGVSFQQCTDILVERCHVHDNTGGGLHPGSGSVRWVIQHCNVTRNGRDGLFYCLRTTHGICRNNQFVANGHAGISVGERDTDHLIEANLVKDNGTAGVEFRKPVVCSGNRVRLIGNTIEHNGGKAQIIVRGGLEDVHIEANAIATRDGGDAILVEPSCRRISAVANTINGRPQQPSDIRGKVNLTRPATLPPVGPEALPLDGARHLHIERLAPWSLPG